MSLVSVDANSEVSVTTLLENARTWLMQAVDASPMEIAFVKAQIGTAADATKRLDLSREIKDDAEEMVRRAEYALGKAIRKGQEEGTVAAENNHNRLTVPSTAKASPTDFAKDVELYDRPSQGKVGILSIADSASPEEFDQAVTEARAEGNLSRANVGRHAGAAKSAPPNRTGATRSPEMRLARADLIRDLAEQGYSSRQMPSRVGVTEVVVRRIARDFDIEIPADRMVGGTRRIDHTAAVDSAVTELENWAGSLTFIDFAEVDPSEADEWLSSLTKSISELRRFIKQIKENSRV